MKVGIIVGISEHFNPAYNLPAGEKDFQLVLTVCTLAKKYDHILEISKKESASVIKNKISNFVRDLIGKKVKEFFFYFSGHGELVDDEFFFVLPDYNPKQRKLTCLENSELDGLIRSLSPDLTVKAIDACHSGVAYIKDPHALEEYFNSTKGSFKDCYFLFSSLSSQKSFQDKEISDFTRNLLLAMHVSESPVIRYKEIIDFISDNHEPSQIPYFVTQASFTDSFITKNEEVRDFLKGIFNRPSIIEMESPKAINNLVDLVRQEAMHFVKKDEALKVIEKIVSTVQAFSFPGDLKEIFEIEIELNFRYTELPQKAVIGSWLDKSGKHLFADPIFENEEYWTEEKTPSKFLAIYQMFSNEVQTRSVKKIREKIVGFSSRINLPIEAIHIYFKPKFENLNPVSIFFVVFLSKNECQMFFSKVGYSSYNWDEHHKITSFKWLPQKAEMFNENEILSVVKTSLEKLVFEVLSELEEKYRNAII